MTTNYVAPQSAQKLFFTNNTRYVALTGSDVNGNDGSIDRPFRTIGAAITASASGGAVLVGPGTFAEQVNIIKSIYVSALVPGATVIDCATPAVASLTITGTVATQRVVWEGIDVNNSNNASAASVALSIVGGGVAGNYVFKNCKILAGSTTANAATAISFAGNAGNGTKVLIQSPRVMGGLLHTVAHTLDDVIYNNCYFERGPAIWLLVAGAAAGNIRLDSCRMQGATGTEYIEYGNAAATTAILNLGSSRIVAYLNMNTTGAGYVNIEDSSVSYVQPNSAARLNQIVRYINGDYLRIALINTDLDPAAPAAVTMYQVPANRRFNPERVVTTNRGAAASGAALNYRYNGTGAGSVVNALGVAALATGSTVNTCVQDSLAAGVNLQFDIVAASTTDADRADAIVYGRLT